MDAIISSWALKLVAQTQLVAATLPLVEPNLPSNTDNNQLAIGDGSNRWIAGDSSYNVTLSGIATVYAATGIVSATKFCGDGSALTNISAGFDPDAQHNLIAETAVAGSYDPHQERVLLTTFIDVVWRAVLPNSDSATANVLLGPRGR